MKCFYHLSDMDGWCSAAIVAKFTNNYNKEDYIGIDYNNHKIADVDLSIIENGEEVYISDLSFTDETIHILDALMNKCGDKLIWNDHHKSSIELCKKFTYLKNIKGVRSVDDSGAFLTWVSLYTNPMPKAVMFVSDWDCFHFKYGETTRHFKYGIDQDPWFKFPLSHQWKRLLDVEYSIGHLSHVINVGKILDSYIKTDYETSLKSNVYETTFAGYKMAVINRSCNSLIFGNLYNKYPIVSTFSYDGEKWKYSLYSSDKSVNCEAIARQFGGGGHKGAAGFASDKLLYKKTASIDFNQLKEEPNE